MRSLCNKNGMRRLLAMARGTAVAAVLATSGAAWAVPSQVTLEGALTSSGGGPAPDGTYNLVFAVYKDASGGNAVWSEGPLAVAVKNGLFQSAIGTKTPLAPATLAGLPAAYLGIKVEADAELPRQQMLSTAFALRAGVAEAVDCSGCIPAAALDPSVLAPYAKTADLGVYAKTASLKAVATTGSYADLINAPVLVAVATSGKYTDLIGIPDLAPYAKTASLKAVATTGAYADLSGAPVLAKVATSGSYVDLSNQPVAAKLGAACGTGLVMKGIKADGTYDCAAGASGPVEVKNLPADGIDEISNGLIFNQFNDTFSGKTGAPIPDNNPEGVTDTINYPDIGLSQKLTVTVDVSNSNIAGLTLSLVDPDGVKYVLYAKGGSGVAVKTSYPLPTAPVSGDLKTWVGKNPKGAWKLTAVDDVFLDNKFDGAINAWSITSQTLSSKKIAVAGNMLVSGNLTVNGSVDLGTDSAPCDASNRGALRYDDTYGTEVCNGADWVTAKSRPVMWSGGCKTSSSGGGEATYCLDGVDFANTDKYLSINTNGYVTVKIDGFYRLNVYMDGITTSYRRLIFRKTPVGGSEQDIAYAHMYESVGGWHFISLDNTLPFKKGDVFRVVSQNDTGNVRWHSWNSLGQHSRAQFSYEGPLAN